MSLKKRISYESEIPFNTSWACHEVVYFTFFVEETETGIPKECLQAIFNCFEQADIADIKVDEGLGLGLVISKAYAEILRSKIFVKAEEGIGSRFTIPYM